MSIPEPTENHHVKTHNNSLINYLSDSLQRWGAVGTFLLAAGFVIVCGVTIVDYAPWPTKADVATQTQLQTQINQGIVKQLDQMNARQLQDEDSQVFLTDDFIALQQWAISQPKNPYIPPPPQRRYK